MISWRNIPPEQGRLTWDDYLEHGVLTALAQAKAIGATATVNALGFCVGGTLLASALAVLAARHDHSVESATFLTTMLDFADPGEIGVYVSREYLQAREPMLLAGERVHGGELAGAFASLRANDLVWNYVVKNYLKGETPPAFDLLHWNGDSANLPGPMYVYYLRNLYLDNKLIVPGALTMLGERIDLGRITMPAYVYASRDDHIVPWRSGYRTTALLGGEPTFVLGASGHIAGVINPPAKQRRNHWTNELLTDDPDDWLARATSHPGSWWPHWGAWLSAHAGALRLRHARAATRNIRRWTPRRGATYWSRPDRCAKDCGNMPQATNAPCDLLARARMAIGRASVASVARRRAASLCARRGASRFASAATRARRRELRSLASPWPRPPRSLAFSPAARRVKMGAEDRSHAPHVPTRRRRRCL